MHFGLAPAKIKIGVMDGLPGLERAFREAFPGAVTARCWVHAMKNAVAKVPARLRDAFEALALKVMYAEGESAALLAFGPRQSATRLVPAGQRILHLSGHDTEAHSGFRQGSRILKIVINY